MAELFFYEWLKSFIVKHIWFIFFSNLKIESCEKPSGKERLVQLNLEEMNNHLIYDSQLLEAMRENDTTAFEKLFDRYWFLLFQYANSKLDSEEGAKEIVRDIFIDLWENRSAITDNFSLIVHLYSRLRKMVAANLYKQICEQSIEFHRKRSLVAEFSVQHLKTAYRPVSLKPKIVNGYEEAADDLKYPLLYMLKNIFHYSRNYCLRILMHEIPARFSKTFL